MLSGLEKYTKYDLVSAVKRQGPFFYQVLILITWISFIARVPSELCLSFQKNKVILKMDLLKVFNASCGLYTNH